MIDTCHLKYQIQIPGELLVSPWRLVASQRTDGTLKVRYWREHYFNGAKIRLVYYQEDYMHRPLLMIEISSIPKLIYGNNIIHLHSVEVAIEAVNAILAQIIPELNIDISQGIPERIDFYQDFFVGEYVKDYIQGISRLFYPHRSRCIYSNQPCYSKHQKNNGVVFWSDDYRCSFYDKQLESGDDKAYGLLRLESSIRDTDEISASTGLAVPALSNITPSMKYGIIQRDLVRLGLWESRIFGSGSALDELKRYFPPRKANRLYYILSVIHDHPMLGKQQLAIYLGIQSHALNISLNEINSAGITSSLIDRQTILPPLNPTTPIAEKYEYSPKVPSDTEIPISLGIPDEIRLLRQM